MLSDRRLKIAVASLVVAALSLTWSIVIGIPGCDCSDPPDPPPPPHIYLFFCDTNGNPRTDVVALSPVGEKDPYKPDVNGRVFLPRSLIGARVSIRDSTNRELLVVTIADKGPEAQRIELP